MARQQVREQAALHPELLSLLKAAKDDPQDEPRLVLADWLEEHGDTPADRARGELIRLQCELATLPKYTTQFGLRRAVLAWREKELLKQHRKAWLGPLAGAARSTTWYEETFRRGMIHILVGERELASKSLVRLAETDTFAWVEGVSPGLIPVRAGGPASSLEALGAWPLVARMASVDRSMMLGVDALASSPYAANLTTLGPADNGIDDEGEQYGEITTKGAKALASARALGGLVSLNLAGNKITAKGIEALVGSAPWAGLRRLVLDANPIGVEGAKALAASCALTKLATLSLACRNPEEKIGPRGAAALATSPNLAGLTTLILNGNAIGDAGAAALAASPHLARLTTLELGDNGIGPEGAQALARSPYVTNLARLNLSNNPIGDSGAAALAGSLGLTSLTDLTLEVNQIGDAGAGALAGAASLPRLVYLNLRDNAITKVGVAALARSPLVGNLIGLSLGENRVGVEGAEALGESPHVGRLQVLDLYKAGLTAFGAEPLALSTTLTSLVILNVSENGLSLPWQKELRKRYGEGVQTRGWSF